MEALGKNSLTQRVFGVRVLTDLAKTSSPDQIGLIIRILHDHLKNRGKIRYEKDDQGNYKIDSNGRKS